MGRKFQPFLTFMIIVLFVCCLMPIASAEENFQYSINNGKVTIEKFKEELSGFYNIPEKVKSEAKRS